MQTKDGVGFVATAPAKINLCLRITGRRPDGYHEIDTVISTVSLVDSLCFYPNDSGQIVVRTQWLPGHERSDASDLDGDRNICFRALELLRRRIGNDRLGGRLTIWKRIPTQAGLGGGSSDAAAALQLAIRGWNATTFQSHLPELAAQLGSDVPFFLTGGVARCRGRGERVEPLRLPQPLWIVIAKPPVGLSTAEVYRRFRRTSDDDQSMTRWLAAASTGATRAAHAAMFNQLQPAASEMLEDVSRLSHEFDRVGCRGHQMSGSGSAYFGLFPSRECARRAACRLRQSLPHCQTYTCRSCSHPPSLNNVKMGGGVV